MHSRAQVSAIIVAILSLMSPNSPMGRPKARRSLQRSTAILRTRLHIPRPPLARPRRPLLSTSIATLNPRPGSPRMAEAGTRTSSKKTSVVELPRMPSLCSLGPFFTPHARSTRNAVIFGFAPSSAGEVRAKTVKRSAMPPLVIQIFDPLST